MIVRKSRASARLFTGTDGSLAMSGVAAVLLLLTSLCATIVPAMRATHTDPTNALRQE